MSALCVSASRLPYWHASFALCRLGNRCDVRWRSEKQHFLGYVANYLFMAHFPMDSPRRAEPSATDCTARHRLSRGFVLRNIGITSGNSRCMVRLRAGVSAVSAEVPCSLIICSFCIPDYRDDYTRIRLYRCYTWQRTYRVLSNRTRLVRRLIPRA